MPEFHGLWSWVKWGNFVRSKMKFGSLFFILLVVTVPATRSDAVEQDRIPMLPNELQKFVDLANVATSQGKFDEAQKAAQEAIQIVDKKFKKSPERAEAYNLMAGVLFARGNLLGAFKYHNKALDFMQDSLGREHPRYAQILVTRAGTYTTLGLQMEQNGKNGRKHFADAEKDLMIAQDIFKKTRNPNSQWTRMVESGLKQVRTKMKARKG